MENKPEENNKKCRACGYENIYPDAACGGCGIRATEAQSEKSCWCGLSKLNHSILNGKLLAVTFHEFNSEPIRAQITDLTERIDLLEEEKEIDRTELKELKEQLNTKELPLALELKKANDRWEQVIDLLKLPPSQLYDKLSILLEDEHD